MAERTYKTEKGSEESTADQLESTTPRNPSGERQFVFRPGLSPERIPDQSLLEENPLIPVEPGSRNPDVDPEKS